MDDAVTVGPCRRLLGLASQEGCASEISLFATLRLSHWTSRILDYPRAACYETLEHCGQDPKTLPTCVLSLGRRVEWDLFLSTIPTKRNCSSDVSLNW